MLPSARIDRITFHPSTFAEALDRIFALAAEQRSRFVVTSNTDHVLIAHERDDFAFAVSQSDLVVADGMPIVWALRRMGFESAERVTGADLLPGISQRCAKSGQTIFLCGGMEGWADTAARNLQSQFPGLKVAGTIFPPFGFEKNEKASGQMIEAINRVSPDFLFVGVGCPKQELWIQNYRHRLNCGVIMGVGMAIAFSANATKRAPKWMHDIGAEWFFRMMTEPRRLGPRYMKDLQVFPLLARAIKEAKESRSPTSEGGK